MIVPYSSSLFNNYPIGDVVLDVTFRDHQKSIRYIINMANNPWMFTKCGQDIIIIPIIEPNSVIVELRLKSLVTLKSICYR